MNRLSKGQIQEIMKLTKEGKSLNSIAEETGKSKTTVYYHFNKIRGKCVNPIQVNNRDNELIGEFIGLFAGDGCLNVDSAYRHRIFLYFNITEKIYVENLINEVLINIFDRRPRVYRDENRLNLVYYSKAIGELVKLYLTWNPKFRKTYSVKLKNEVHSRAFILGFLRGCLDSDGHLSSKKIQFSSVSYGLIQNISNFLNYLRINHKVSIYKEKRENRKDIYRITIPKSNHSLFTKLIKPRNLKGTEMRRPGFEFPNASPQRFPDTRLPSE